MSAHNLETRSGRVGMHSATRIWTMLSALALVFIPSWTNAQTLGFTNGLQLWLKAGAGVTTNGSGQVSAWADQSGNHSDVSQSYSPSQPTWVASGPEGLPSILFNGGNNLFNTNVNLVASGVARTVFIVAQTTNTTTWPSSLIGGTLFTFRRSGPVMTLQQLDPALWVHNYIYSDGVCCNEWTADSRSVIANPFVATYRSPGAGGTMSAWLDANSTPILSGSQAVASDSGSTGFDVGFRADYYNAQQSVWNGYISEILVFNGALTDPQRLQVADYLGDKYGIAVPEPSSLMLLALGGLLLRLRREKL